MGNPTDTLHHLTLGCSIRGSLSASTIQFRNLKYASIPARYKESIPVDTLVAHNGQIVDATRFGPSCPHARGARAWDMARVGNVELPCEPGQGQTELMDEFECLHTNITVPASVVDSSNPDAQTLLPVFVWVHGGGLSMGSNNWPQYDLRGLVQRSVDCGKPIIAVAINYRLNVFGFLASNDVGADGNMGFKDQALAFRWIRKHIRGFGGDPHNVTAAGESAGGISLSTLLSANVGYFGLFDKVIVMSGETTLRKPRHPEWQEHMYEDQSGHLGIDDKDKDSLRTALLETDAEALAQRLPLAQHWTATIDGKWLKDDVSLESMMDGQSNHHKPRWCKEYVIGDTTHDGTILKARVLDHPQRIDRLKKACKSYLTRSETETLLSAYNLTDTQCSQAIQSDRLLVLVSELRFYLPVLAAYRGWKASPCTKRAYRYHFHIPNPVEGEFTGIATHELDVAYLLQTCNNYFDEKNRILAREMADKFVSFLYDGEWAKEGNLLVFSNDGMAEVAIETYDQLYRQGRGETLQQIGVQKLWLLAESWQGVREERDVIANATRFSTKL